MLLVAAAVIVSIALASAPKQALSQDCGETTDVPDRILVKMAAGASDESVERMKNLNGEGAEEKSVVADLWVVDVPAGLSVTEAVELYEGSPEVVYAEPDYRMVPEQPCPPGGASIEVALSDSPDPVFVGDNLFYGASIRNHGPETARNVELTSVVPRGTEFVSSNFANGDAKGTCPPGEDRIIRCAIGDLRVGESADLELVVRPTEPGLLSNLVDARADNALLGVETSASTTTTVLPAPSQPEPEPPAPAPSNPLGCTIRGDNGPDRLVGTSGRDVICGRGGDDVLLAGGGNDVVYGGPGRDVASGGAGKDRLYGGRSGDVLRVRDGVSGNDLARGGLGKDTVVADPDDDVRD